jgi:hypothetical protein
MIKTVIAAALASAVASGASAALVNVTGGTEANLPDLGPAKSFYDQQDIPGHPDPWPDAGALKGIASLGLGDDVTIDVTYRGKEAGFFNSVEFGSAGGFDTSSAPGTTLTGLTKDQFEGLLFNGTFGVTSEYVAVQAFGHVIEIGFNDTAPVDADFDDLRFKATVVPVPAALPLMLTAVGGLAWWSRRRRSNMG